MMTRNLPLAALTILCIAGMTFADDVSPAPSPSPTPSPSASPSSIPSLDPACKIPDDTIVSRTKTSLSPNYFFRTFPNKRMVSFASNDGNFILDLDTGGTYEVPGAYDPVPAGESLMTVPGNITFYSVPDLIAKNDKSQAAALLTSDLGGVYQSIGIVSKSQNQTVYRVITDQDEASYIDVQVDTSSPTPLLSVLQAPKKLCSNVVIKLPMLSKDGTEVAGFDETNSVTKVYSIDIASGTCKEVLNLGIPTGKADFSWDNQKLVFHVTSNQVDEADYFQKVTPNEVKNIYVYDRENKTFSKITQNFATSSYYPVWRADNTIVYIDIDQDGNASFVVADPSKAKSIPADSFTGTSGATVDQATLAIGAAWYDSCANITTANPAAATLVTLNMDSKQCAELVENYWQKNEAKYGAMGLAKDLLLAACPKETHFSTDVNVVGQFAKPLAFQTPTAYTVAEKKCAICHGTRFDFKEPTNIPIDLRKKMVEYINSGKMPADGTLSKDEKDLLIPYLRAE